MQFVLVVAMAFGMLAFAAAPVGVLSFNGSAGMSRVGFDVAPTGGGAGAITVSNGSSGDFAGFVGTSQNIGDLDFSTQPVGVPIYVPNWLTLPGYTFALQFIVPGSPIDCSSSPPTSIGESCTLPPSPFVFTSLGNSTAISFGVSGTVTNAAGEAAAYTGIFTTQILSPASSVISAMISGVTLTRSFAAQFAVIGPLDPLELSVNLMNDVNSLAVDSGIQTSLLAKLNAATSAMSQDRPGACGQLGAFINEVLAQKGHTIPEAQADGMIATAEQIRTLLGCG
jgi:hypothetical protein